jgi:hypothetical protein
MELSAVLLARAIAFLDINELNPRGAVFFPKIIPAIVERFSFQVFPSKPEDFDESKGVKFTMGYFDGHSIDELTVFNDGIVLSMRSSTTHAKAVITDTLIWLAENHGITYNERTISRWNYVSNLAFSSEVDLDFINPAFAALVARVGIEMKGDVRVTGDFHVASISFDVDRTSGVKQLAPFKIERRSKIAFSEGKYFSAAPLQTDVHISLLEQFEAAIRDQVTQ